jgi:hypothetical protein
LYYLSVPTILVPSDIPAGDEEDPLNISDELEIFKTPKPAKLPIIEKPKPSATKTSINPKPNLMKTFQVPTSSSLVTIPAQTTPANRLVPIRTIFVNKVASPSPSSAKTNPTIVSSVASSKSNSGNSKDSPAPRSLPMSKLVFREVTSEKVRPSTGSESSVDLDDADFEDVDVVIMPQTSTSTTLAGSIFNDRKNSLNKCDF